MDAALEAQTLVAWYLFDASAQRAIGRKILSSNAGIIIRKRGDGAGVLWKKKKMVVRRARNVRNDLSTFPWPWKKPNASSKKP